MNSPSETEEAARAPSPLEVIVRSLECGQLGHAYLFAGDDLAELEEAALALAKIVNCQAPPRSSASGLSLESCGRCRACRRIDERNHPDIQWVRPESKSRVIRIDQILELMRTVNLKPADGSMKVAILVSADRLNPESANAFLKTLEEPPERSLILLLTVDPAQVLETILSRCIRLRFSGGNAEKLDRHLPWLETFARLNAAEGGGGGVLKRYRLLGLLLSRLAEVRSGVQERLSAASPLEKYDDPEPALREKWEDELAAAIEAEYRRERNDVLLTLYWWLRDLWLQKQNFPADLLKFPGLASANSAVLGRIGASETLENLSVIEETQDLLDSNVQEALTLEVGLLKLKLA